jgi:hypothetical protein
MAYRGRGRRIYFPMSKYEAQVGCAEKVVERIADRFSIVPLYWTQPGYGLKPAPTLDPERTPEQHLNVLKAHFEKSVQRYGPNVSGPLSRLYV